MAAYLIANYRITNPEAYAAYPPAVAPTLRSHGGQLLVADFDTEIVEGEASRVTIVVKFPDKQSAHNWYDSTEYQEIIQSRTDNTEGFVVFADGYEIT